MVRKDHPVKIFSIFFRGKGGKYGGKLPVWGLNWLKVLLSRAQDSNQPSRITNQRPRPLGQATLHKNVRFFNDEVDM